MKKPTTKLSGGFSLVELLVVIAVIAIIAAIAIPNIANITGAASESAAQRNAQNLASVYAAAVAAGVPANDIGVDEGGIIGSLTGDGVTATVGNVPVGPFRVDGFPTDADQVARVMRYLVITEGVAGADGALGTYATVVYNPNPTQPGDSED
jgi:prepilin-type N-terminal cleavage/methylation domain-containing protein